MKDKIDQKKAKKLINEGDELEKKGQFKDALKKYKKAKKYDPERPDLYDRLIEAHDKSTKKWKARDVVDSVGWVMEKQETENPSIRLLHKRLDPEWEKITDKISKLIMCDTEEEELRMIEEIEGFGKDAIYPLIYTILQIKKGAKDAKKGEPCQTKGE